MNQGLIQKLVNNFVTELHGLFQQEMLQTLTHAVAGKAKGGGVSNGSNGSNGSRGAKRAPEDLEQLAEKFVTFVKTNPGLRIEQINKQLGSTTKDLALPIRKLLTEKRIKVKGQKRSTQYFVGKD